MASKTLEVYNFTGQPFALGRYDVERIGREAEWDRLNQLVNLARDSKSPVTGVLLGTYGAGKSFLLWQLAKTLRAKKQSRVFAMGPVRLVDPEQKRDFTRNLVLRLFNRGLELERDLLPALELASKAGVSAPANLRPFVDLLMALTRPDATLVARRVLSGGRALRKEAEEAGITDAPQIKTPDDAIGLLEALQVLLRAAGFTALALLIDEVEYVEALPKGQRATVLDSLKHIWDQEVSLFSTGTKAAGLLMLLAATPEFWTRARMPLVSEGGRGESGVGITPFFHRIRQADVVEMPAELASDEARELIVSRMLEVRAGQKKEDIIPFTDDYVEYVYELSQGLPRRIIEICGVVIAEAADRKLKKINTAAAKKILSDLLISYEPLVRSGG